MKKLKAMPSFSIKGEARDMYKRYFLWLNRTLYYLSSLQGGSLSPQCSELLPHTASGQSECGLCKVAGACT